MWNVKRFLHARHHATSDGISKAVKKMCPFAVKLKLKSYLGYNLLPTAVAVVVLPGVIVAHSHHHPAKDGLHDGVPAKWEITYWNKHLISGLNPPLLGVLRVLFELLALKLFHVCVCWLLSVSQDTTDWMVCDASWVTQGTDCTAEVPRCGAGDRLGTLPGRWRRITRPRVSDTDTGYLDTFPPWEPGPLAAETESGYWIVRSGQRRGNRCGLGAGIASKSFWDGYSRYQIMSDN